MRHARTGACITAVTAIPFRIPYRRVHWQAIGALDALENVLVRIETNAGVTGIGEALSTNKFNSNSLVGTALAIRDHLAPAILGADPLNVHEIWTRMNRARLGETFAKGGIDIALHDLAGKLLDVPVWALLGGRSAAHVPIEGPGYGIGVMSPGEMAEAARRAADLGLTQIEIKISGNLTEDVRRLEKVRAAIGSGPSLKIDMTEGYGVKDAIRAIRALEPFGVQWIEQPVHHTQLEGLRDVREAVTTPIVVDESATTVEDLLAVVKARAADGVHIKLPVVGGFTVARKLLAVTEAAHLDALPGSDTASGVGLAAALHFAASWPSFARGIHGSPLARTIDDIVKEPVPESAVTLAVPDAPGLGIELDLAKLERFAVAY
ncbi:MAG: mandelate racemase/muconate lactonizing enzyme family protein [Vicinamibacterales bacterium]